MASEKHLDLIAGVIARMASNSFQIKTWAVTLSTASLGFAASKESPGIAAITLVPVSAFWYLDSYYLRQERLYRRLYEKARRDSSDDPYSLTVSEHKASAPSLLRTAFTPVVSMVHGLLFVTVTAVSVVTAWKS
ncbi:hypothetical protein Are01nite_10810 [Actinoplanes regularis]|nr:hypothetical protein Are01nite_10810 [Actinoplanes regularis]